MSKKVALVVGVGAPRGIGGATALQAGEAGHVVVPVARTEAKLASLATVIHEAGGEAQPVAADITTEEGIRKVFAHIDQLGELDFVLYNAGNMGATSETLEIPIEGFEQAWRVCCWGGLRIGQEAGRRMKARGAGTLIYTGATASLRSKPPFVAFAAAKAGVRALAMGLARELWSSGVHVAHVIIDGLVDGETMASRMPDLKAEMEGRMLDPTAIASAFWSLHVQDRSAWTAELDLRPYADTF